MPCSTMATSCDLDTVSNCVVLVTIPTLITSPFLNATEKTHVFRIEETFPSPSRSPARTAKTGNGSSVTAQTPPPPKDISSAPNTPSPLTPQVAATPSYASQPVAFATPQPLPQPLPQPQAVIVPHYMPQQSPVPFVMPQVSYCNNVHAHAHVV